MAHPIPQYQYPGPYQHPQAQNQYSPPQPNSYPHQHNAHDHQYATQYQPQHAQPYSQNHRAFTAQNQQQWQGHHQYPQMPSPGQIPNYSQNYGQQGHQPPPSHFAQQEPETCFNCGHPDHFAQNCPEPRREIPAGQIKRQKRFQHRRSQPHLNAPVNLSPAPLPGPAHGPQPQYQQTPYPQPFAAAQYNQFANGPNQWNQPSTPSLQPQTDHWNVHQSPASIQPSHSPPNSVQFHNRLQRLPTTPGQWSDPGQRTHSQTPQASSAHESANPTPQGWRGTHSPVAVLEGADSKGESGSGQVDSDSESAEDEEDDLSALDIPDQPTNVGPHAQGSVQLVSCPLPSNFIVADALYPLAAPGPTDNGRCSSKYFLHTSEEKALESIHTSTLWKDRREDTMFRGGLNDLSMVPLSECMARIADRRDHSSSEEKENKSRNQSRALAPRSAEAAEMAESLEKVEQALAEAKRMIANKQSKPKARVAAQQQDNEHRDRPDKLQHPSATSRDTRVSHPPSGAHNASPSNCTDHLSRKSSEDSPNVARTDTVKTNSNQGTRYYEQIRHSRPNGAANVDVHFRQPHHGIPPPPPPPSEGIDNINPSMSHHGHGRNGADAGKANGVPFRGFPSEQPPTLSRRTSSYGSKRSYEQRMESSSSDEGDSPRRQEDDVTPKYKRRQPKVAEAYSRRW